jgi:hypothetical protein
LMTTTLPILWQRSRAIFRVKGASDGCPINGSIF